MLACLDDIHVQTRMPEDEHIAKDTARSAAARVGVALHNNNNNNNISIFAVLKGTCKFYLRAWLASLSWGQYRPKPHRRATLNALFGFNCYPTGHDPNVEQASASSTSADLSTTRAPGQTDFYPYAVR